MGLSGLAVDAAGHVYVADASNHRIQVFDSQGNFLRKWGSEGSGDGQFAGLRSVATDTHGNVYAADAHRVQVFAIVPVTSLDSHPAARTGDATPRFTFSADERDSTFECELDARAWVGCTSPYTTRKLADGPHRFRVRGIYGENADPTPASFRFTVDTSPPQTTIRRHPPHETRREVARFAFGSDERARFECKLDGKGWMRCASPRIYRNLEPGIHSFRVRATDRAGNSDRTPAKWRWRILG